MSRLPFGFKMAGSTSHLFLIILSFCLSGIQGFSNGDLRLVDNSGRTGGSSGRLEIYYSGQWGTVCSDRFGLYDARVACRQLGYTGYVPQYGRVGTLSFSQSLLTTPIWLDELRCLGTESRLIDCPANAIGNHRCSHRQDVALVCVANDGDLRLVSNSGRTGGSSGRLEVYNNGQWGTVCDDRFGSVDAKVACRQLGYTNYTQYGRVGTLGFSQSSRNSPTWLDELRCLGTESRLIDCPVNTIGVGDCTHTQDVALVCSADGDLRLVGYSGQAGGSSGRLEVYNNGQWGTVCSDRFGLYDARVACRQLGYTRSSRYGRVGTLGLGFSQSSSTTPTWLDELRCRGTETRLFDCPANAIGVEDCTHTQDVALVCTTRNGVTTTSGGGGGGSNVYTYSGGSVGSFVGFGILVCCCIFCCRHYIKSNSTTRVYTPKTRTVYCAPAKKDSPPPYTNNRSVATTEPSNRSCVAIRVVQRIEASNGFVCQKEQTAIRYISE